MTQEEKILLLQDLCTRLPYNVKVKHLLDTYPSDLLCIDAEKNVVYVNHYGSEEKYKIECIRPYLRPMKSMTEEEFTKLKEYSGLVDDQLDLTSFQNGAYKCLDFYLNEVPSGAVIRVFDWLNKHHFDYRDLIQMGLTLEAPAGMYNS